MAHAKLSILSLLCLLCALLMLPPEQTLGVPLPTDERQYEAMNFAIKQYNEDNQKNSGYVKMVRLEEMHTEVANGVEYHFTMKVVRTGCTKIPGKGKTFKEIQRCQEPLGNTQKETCYFKVTSHPPSNKMKLASANCEEK